VGQIKVCFKLEDHFVSVVYCYLLRQVQMTKTVKSSSAPSIACVVYL